VSVEPVNGDDRANSELTHKSTGWAKLSRERKAFRGGATGRASTI